MLSGSFYIFSIVFTILSQALICVGKVTYNAAYLFIEIYTMRSLQRCKLLHQLAGYELAQRPANGEFIDILYNHLRQEG